MSLKIKNPKQKLCQEEEFCAVCLGRITEANHLHLRNEVKLEPGELQISGVVCSSASCLLKWTAEPLFHTFRVLQVENVALTVMIEEATEREKMTQEGLAGIKKDLDAYSISSKKESKKKNKELSEALLKAKSWERQASDLRFELNEQKEPQPEPYLPPRWSPVDRSNWKRDDLEAECGYLEEQLVYLESMLKPGQRSRL